LRLCHCDFATQATRDRLYSPQLPRFVQVAGHAAVGGGFVELVARDFIERRYFMPRITIVRCKSDMTVWR